ncbi:MAG: GTP cyclohydrolase I FolE [Chloroflexi bacterium]|nr:MAG: GTP cyclohydrolase I FolE [Chloroflexota bacterium]TME19638.1 MAG: GTP cyclohydrolase I FolE [Chloroflexota bacterium]
MSVFKPQFDTDGLRGLVARLLEELGEDTSREGLVDTPLRVAESYRYLTEGYDIDPAEVVGDALFEQQYDDLVVIKDINFFSLCEHHLLPFFGRVHVAYLPTGRVVGLSKVPRLIDVYAHRLQIQERMTREIALSIQQILNPAGVGVVVEARHLCMEMRGIEKPDSETVTSCMLGTFRKDPRTRSEFMELIQRRG